MTSSGGVGSDGANGGGQFDPGAVRVGDAERNSAINALGEHLSSGRLDIEEYGTRSAQATSARTAVELAALFSDLPAPHPDLPGTVVPVNPQPPARPGSASPAVRGKGQQIAAGVAGASGIIAVIAFFLLQGAGWGQAWLVFLLVPLCYGIASSVWGPNWRDGK